MSAQPQARRLGLEGTLLGRFRPRLYRRQWTLTLLAAQLLELALVDTISAACVRTTRKKRTHFAPRWPVV